MSGSLNLNQLDSVPTGFNFSPPPAIAAPQTGGTINISNLDSTPTTNLNAGTPSATTSPQGGFFRNIGAGMVNAAEGVNSLVNAPFAAANNAENNIGYKIQQSGGRFSPATVVPVNPGKTAPPETGILAGPQALQTLSGKIQKAAAPLAKYAANTATTTPLDYAGQGIGQMLPYALTGDLGGIGKAAKTVGAMAAMGAGSGLGQEAGQAIAPDGYKGVGAFVGSLLGGLGGAAGMAGMGKVADAVSDIIPAGGALQKRQALLTLNNMVPNLPAVRQAVADRLTSQSLPTAEGNIPLGPNGEIIPGSRPSVAQLSGNTPAAQLEEALKATGSGAALEDANATSAAARAAVLRNNAPEGSPGSMGEYLQEARANQDKTYAEQVNKTAQMAQGEVEKQPGLAGEVEPYQAGAELQGSLSAPDLQRKEAVAALYQQFRDRNPVMDLSPLKGTVGNIQKNIEAEGAGDVDAKEQSFLSRASELAADPNATWRKMDALRKEVGSYIENASGKFGQPTYNSARMMDLKNGIDAAEQSASDRLPAQSPEWNNVFQNVKQAYSADDVGKVKSSLEAMSQRAKTNERLPNGEIYADDGRSPGIRPGQSGPAGEKQAVGPDGADGNPTGTISVAQRNTGVAEEPPVPNWTKLDSVNLAEARAAHGTRMGLYRNPQIGPLLAKIPGGKFDLTGDALLPRVVPSGPAGGAMARAIKATAEDSPEILPRYQTAIGLDMRRAAMKNGQIDRGALAAWAKAKAPLLSEMPDIASRVSDIDRAQQYAEEAVENRVQSAKTYNEGAFSQILNGHDPNVVMRGLLSGKPTDAKVFMQVMGRHPEALAGAQKAGWDYLASQFLSPRNGGETGEEALNISGLRAMLRDPTKLQNMRTLLGEDAPKTLHRVVQEFDLYNTGSISKLSANGARSTPLAETVKRLQAPKTLLGRMFKGSANPVVDTLAAHAAGAGPIGMGAAYLGSNVAKGYLERSRVAANELLSRAMADPKLFMQLTKSIPQTGEATGKFWRHFMSVFASSAMRTQGQTK
jgi:hypothetical protein